MKAQSEQRDWFSHSPALAALMAEEFLKIISIPISWLFKYWHGSSFFLTSIRDLLRLRRCLLSLYVMNICNVWLKSADHGRMLSRMSRDGSDCYFSWLKSGRSECQNCWGSRNKNTREGQTRRRFCPHITIFVPHQGERCDSPYCPLPLSYWFSFWHLPRRANRNWVDLGDLIYARNDSF